MSKVVIVFEFAGMTHKEYDAVMDELKAQGKDAQRKSSGACSF